MRKLHILAILIVGISFLNSVQVFGQIEPCDVNLIEVAVVDVTGLSGQPNFDNAHICSVADTVRIELGTPGITCNPTATLSLNEFRMIVFDGFIPIGVDVSGGIGGPFTSGTDFQFMETGGAISINMNAGATIEMDQNNPVIIDIILEPNCSVQDQGLAVPQYELDYSLPGNIPSQSFGDGQIDLRSSVFEPFINIIESTTDPEFALPGETVCRTVTIINNGQFSLLDTFSFKDLPEFGFAELTSFDITLIESSTLGAVIDGLPFLTNTTNVDSIEFLFDGVTFGGPNEMFEVDGGVQIEYCVTTQCPAEVNNSMLFASYGCEGDICQESTDLESVVVIFNGIPDLVIERAPIIPADPCVDPLMWEFRIVNDSINGGAFETIEGEADAQDVKVTMFLNECEIFSYEQFLITYANLDGSKDDHTSTTNVQVLGDSICFTGLPDVGVNDTLIIKLNVLLPPDDGLPLECEALVNQDDISCADPWIKVSYEDRCDEPSTEEQSQPINSSFPPLDGNPIMSFTEAEYTEPSYCEPGKLVFELNNLSGLGGPTTTAQDIQFYVRKQFCSLFELQNYEFGTDISTGTSAGVVVDDLSLDSFYIVSIPSMVAQGESLFFSMEIALGCRDSEMCFFDGFECFMPNVKATWENCFDLRWFAEYEFPYKLIDHKPDPSGNLESYGGGAGPISFTGSGCGYRNYWYRYQFGGINYDDCSIKLRYKIAQINADGTAGTVTDPAQMSAGVDSDTGTTTWSTIAGTGGAPDTLVIEVTSDLLESCIEDERILINVQYMPRCTSTVEPVHYYESYEVIFECNNGAECCEFKRSCYENVLDCYCGQPGSTPTCYLFCLETATADLCRTTEGCGNPGGAYSDVPDPKEFGMPCDKFTLNSTANFVRQSASPVDPPCDVVEKMIVEVNPGPYMEYCPATSNFSVTDGTTTLTSSCGTMIPYDANTNEFDLTDCIDWSAVKDGWTINFNADWIVVEDVPSCQEGFMMEEMEVEFKGTFADGGNITNCGSPRTQKAEYFVGDPFQAKMQANLEFENGCSVSASIVMSDDCGVGNVFNDYRPGYILDSIIYNITGAEFTYTDGTAVLTRKGENGPETFPIPISQIEEDGSNGFSIKFINDGSWPEELTRSTQDDSLFCLVFDLEFTECYAYSTNIQADSKIYYHSCGGCGPREIESPGGIEFNNPPSAILNCLSAPIVQTPNDSVTWNIQVGHTPSASFHWVAFDLPPEITFDEVIDLDTGNDILGTAMTNGSVVWWNLGANSIDDLEINALYTECDTIYLPVYVGWSCNGYPDNPVTGEFANGESCNVIQKELAVVRAMTGLQASFVNQLVPPVDLCDTLDFEVVVKNVGIASHFMQEFCFYLPKEGMTLIPESVCFASPDTIPSLPDPGTFMPIPDSSWEIINLDTIINGQPSQKVKVDLNSFMSNLNMDLELPGATFPENNLNKYRMKWRVITDCDYISGSKLYAEAASVDRCTNELFTTAESSDIVPIRGLDPRDYNRNQVVLLDTMLDACISNQIITANLISFPSSTGPNEFVCITIPSEVTLNDVLPFNPVNWDMSVPVTTVVSGGTEYCWEVPEGTPAGVLAFNMDLTVDPATECGMLSFGSYTKVSADAICVTTGDPCNLEIFTSELMDNGMELIPSIKLIKPLFGLSAACSSNGDLAVDASIAIQNQGSNIMAGTAVSITIFADANNNNILDSGEELNTASYTGGVAASQIVNIEASFDVTIAQLCQLKVVAGGNGCACTSDAETIDPEKIELDICTDLPLACEGGQANMLCDDLPTTGFTLDWSSINDPDLDYIDAATGIFGPAPTGVYTYNVTMNLGNGCEISGKCSMQVIGELGTFTLSGEPSCPDEISKCTIELEPLCSKELLTLDAEVPCEALYGLRNLGFKVGQLDFDVSKLSSLGVQQYLDLFNQEIRDTIGTPNGDKYIKSSEVCLLNSFGIEVQGYLLPQLYNDNLNLVTPMICQMSSCGEPKATEMGSNVLFTLLTSCGSYSTTLSWTDEDILEMEMENWLNSLGIGTWMAEKGNYKITGMDVPCSGINFTVNQGLFSAPVKIINECAEAQCSGGIKLRHVLVDVNGNEIEDYLGLCCSQEKLGESATLVNSFNYSICGLPNSNCSRKGIEGSCDRPRINSGAQIGEETLMDNPLNDILLYSWEAEGGDVISQEGNCANIRWSEVGTYEVCATPVLSPESGLDCDIPPVCKDHMVITDDLRATVAVMAAETCTQTSSVNITFETPEDIQSIKICDADGNTVYSESMEGCMGLVSSMQLYPEGCNFGKTCPNIDYSSIAEITNYFWEGYWIFEPGTSCPVFNEDGSLDLTLVNEDDVIQSCNPKDFGFELKDWAWDAASSSQSAEEFLMDFITMNAANFFGTNECNLEGFTTQDCNGNIELIGLPENSIFAFKVAYLTVDGFKEEALLVFGDKPTTVSGMISEIFAPGDYTVKIVGSKCGLQEDYPFTLPEPPSSEVLISMDCNEASNCATADGSINAMISTNGQIDSLVLCNLSGSIAIVDSSMAIPPSFMISEIFGDLPVGEYTLKVYTECGDATETCSINSATDFATIADPVVMQFTDCASNDAQIDLTVESSVQIDSVIWCGPNNALIKEIGPLSSPHSATTGSGITYGDWTAKVYTACANTEQTFTIQTPPPGAAVTVDCNPVSPADCSEAFGSLGIDISYSPAGFIPDSIVVSNAAGVIYTDISGSLSVVFDPLVPGTYTVDVYTTSACNTRSIECTILPAMDEVTIDNSTLPILPCAKLFPDSLSNVVIEYSTTPAIPIVRVDWYKGTSVSMGTLIASHANPNSAMDNLMVAAGEDGNYCVVVIAGDAGLLSSCPRDTLCFNLESTPCPPDCDLMIDTLNLVQQIDCVDGSVFSFDVQYNAAGCVVEEGLMNGSGTIRVEILDLATNTFKGSYNSILPSDITSCTDVAPGNYEITVSYIENGEAFCLETMPLTLVNSAEVEYSIELDIIDTPCDEENGKITITSVSDNLGNQLNPADYDYILYDGFTPIASILSPNDPSFCDLKTDLYTIEMIDPETGCSIASSGGIVENTDAEPLCPNSIIASNNCGPCDGTIIMPDSLGIVYRLQDAMGNLIFPQNAPNEHIFIDVCSGEYQVIAFNLALPVPDECPSICDVTVPISDIGFTIALDTIAGSPCELNDGRILVMAIGGNCGYNYELFDLNGLLVSNSPVPDPSANICGDKSDRMIFLGVAPGDYKVVGFATDSDGNAMSCMHMDTITLRDNDIKINLDDVTPVNALCDEDKNGSFCIAQALGSGEAMEIWDIDDNVVASFGIADATPYCVDGLAAGAYEIRINAGEGFFECTEIIDVLIEEPEPLMCTSVSVNPSDCIEEDGSIDVTVTGGTSDYSIVWDDAALSGFALTNLPVGEYPFEITDMNGCVKRDTASLEVPICNEPCPEIVEEFAVVDAECGESNGNIFVTVQGEGTYSYLWDTGAMTQEIADLPVGIYCVTITSLTNAECVYTACQEVDEIDGPLSSAEIIEATCDEDGSITLTITGGTPGYMATWDGPGANDGGPVAATTGFSITGVDGAYSITLTDAEGCSNILLEEIEKENGLQVTAQTVQFPSCTSNDGEIKITSVDGTFPFEFYVNDILLSTQNGNMFSLADQGPGQYFIEVIDGTGCVGETSITLSTGGGPTIDPGEWEAVDAICSGDDGHIEYTGAGSSNIEYSIFAAGSTTPLGATTADVATIFEVPVGTYSIICEDLTTGCSDVLPNVVVEGPQPLDFVVQYQDPISCEELGSISIVEITGDYDNPDLSISINGGSFSYNGILETPQELLAGTYTITVCYTGTDGSTVCCKEREITLDGIASCCEGIAGDIFYDDNANGCQDAGEGLVMEDVVVSVYECGDVPGMDAPTAITTVNDGMYDFSVGSEDLGADICLDPDGEYFVVFDIPNGPGGALENYNFTPGTADMACSDAGESDDVNETNGQSECYDPSDDDTDDEDDDEHIDAGIVPGCESIAGEIFYDDNANGCQDGTEGLVMEDVQVSLFLCGDDPATATPVASTTVDDGEYEFGEDSNDEGADVCLEAGTDYFVVFDLPNGTGEALQSYEFTPAVADMACSDAGQSDDVDPNTGESECYDPSNNDDDDDDSDEDIDVGIVSNCEQLAGEIFYDGNENGCQDAGEGLVMEAVGVSLYTCGDDPDTATPVASTTVSDGMYEFGEDSTDPGADVCLEAGTQYFVVFDVPNGVGEVLEDYTVTTGTADMTCEADGQSDDVNSTTGTSACYDPSDTDGIDGDSDENIDIGIVPPCEQLGGEIFYDVNNNGCQDDDETLVDQDINVTLFECGDDPVTATPVASTTVNDGVYNFGLASDDEGAAVCLDADTDYFVVFDIPNDAGEALEDHEFSTGTAPDECAEMGDSDDVDPTTGQSECHDPKDDDDDDDDDDEHIDVGIVPPCESIAGEIFYDGNNNGCQDGGETLVNENIDVALYECGDIPGVDDPVASTTVSDGMYEFGEDSDDLGADVCLDPHAEYFVFFDIPNDSGEALEDYEFSTGTASDECVDAGDSDDVNPATGQSECHDPEDDDDDDENDDEHIDVGITPPCEQLAGEIFYDGNENGCQDAGEGLVMEEIGVSLFECGDDPDTATPVASTTVNDGQYAFGLTSDDEGADVCLDAGVQYFVVFDLPNNAGEALDGFDFTEGTADMACEAAGQSDDVDPATGQSACYDPDNDDNDDGDDDENIDVGITSPCEQLAGEIFYDGNENGCQDPGEGLVMEEIGVSLYTCGDDPDVASPVASTTVSDGQYAFGLTSDDDGADVCLDAGTQYFVVFDIPNAAGEALENHTITTGTADMSCEDAGQSDDVDSSTGTSECYDPDNDDGDDGDEDENIDIGIVPPCEQIAGEIFYDENNNGCQDPGEGLVDEDINVTLYECGDEPGVDAPVASTTVNDGVYNFGLGSDDEGAAVCLDADTDYFVVFDLPNGIGEALEGHDFSSGEASAECEAAGESDDVGPLTGQSECHDPKDDDDDDDDDDEHIDVGITSPCEEIAGEIFYDGNNNGCQDNGEGLVDEDINVSIYECGDDPVTDSPVASTTVSDGTYEFGENSDDEGADVCLDPDKEYFVVFDIPNAAGEALEDYEFSSGVADAECMESGDSSDVDPLTGQSECHDPEDDDPEDEDEDEHIDAGITPPCEQLAGDIFFDGNENGCQDPGEGLVMESIEVSLYTCGDDPDVDPPFASTTVNDGHYAFGLSSDDDGADVCLDAGTQYYVVFDIPNDAGEILENYEVTSGTADAACEALGDADDVDQSTATSECYDPDNEDPDDGVDDEHVDIGIVPPCEQIAGEIFYDNDDNGCEDAEEELVTEDIEVSLYECGQEPGVDDPVASTTVNDGVYNFGLASDDEGADVCLDGDKEYFVVFNLPNDEGQIMEDFTFSQNEADPSCEAAGESSDVDPDTGESECHDPDDDDGDDDEDIDVGVVPPCYELAGEIYYDTNNNGCQDNGEGLVNTNVTISLYECGDEPGTDLPTAVTSVVDGDYMFGEGSTDPGADICLEPNTEYFVVFSIPNSPNQALEDYVFTAGTADNACQISGEADDVNMMSGMSACYDPDNDDDDDGDDDEHIDAGINSCQSMGGEVFLDADNNGCQDDDETNITSSIDVELFECDTNGDAVGIPVATASTDEDGAYSFGPDEDGDAQICLDPDKTYTVVFNLPNSPGESMEGYEFSSNQDVCGDPSDSNDVIGDGGKTDCYDPKDDDDDEDIDAGIVFFDLALNKTTNAGPVVSVGDTIKYIIEVFNQGSITATKIEIVDYLTPEFIFDPSLNPGWSLSGTDLVYLIEGPLLPGDSFPVCMELILDPNQTITGFVDNYAEITFALDGDGDPAKDIDSDPDDDQFNDPGGNPDSDDDDEILENGFGGGDEDDHDPERILVVDCHELACLGDINLSLDNTCSSEITAAMVLADASNDNDLYEIVITDEFGNVVDNLFDFTDIGNTFFVSVSLPDCDDNSCWSSITIEDKFIPSIDCGDPVRLPCNATEADYPDPIVTDNCGGAELVMVNQTITPAECEDYLRVIERTFIAVDAQGNQSAPCTQMIIIDRVNPSGIQFPANFTSSVCTTSTDPSNTGVPMFAGKPIYPEVPSQLCNMFVTYEDIPLGSGDCSLSFMRRWNVGEWYCGTTANPMSWVQIIEVKDLTPPSITCPANMTVTTNGGFGVCEAIVTLPAATVNDDCNNPVEVVINGGVEVVFGNGGEVMLPVGITTLTYVAYDGCYNSSTCEMTVTVADETQPTIVCKLNTVVSLPSTGLAEVLAEVFDNGSFDDCQIDRFEAARMDDICNVSGTDFGPSVTFCCADVGNEVMVRLRVYDSSGNHNECMVAVEVQDKEPATLSCPPNETVECTTPYDVTNLSIQFGTYTVDDNCANQVVTETVVEDIDQCGLGTVRRTFTMPDGLGGTLSCTQVITFENSDPFDGDNPNDLIWPLDLTIDGMCTEDDVHPDNLNAPFNFPIITEDACDLVGVNYEDQVFDFVAGEDACFKVLRTWKVIDWCQNVNGTFDTWEYEQIIKITNDVAPTIVSGCDDQLVETLDCDASFVSLQISGSDDCTTADGLSYSYSIENLGSGGIVSTGSTNDASGMFNLGTYEITWIVLDGCGNEVTCFSTFEIISNKAPVAYCIQGLSTELIMMDTDGDGIPDTEMVELWATDFDAGSYHSCGYAVTLSFSSDPTDTNITFDCSQQGQQGVQLWVTDENGNQTFCNTFVIVDDNDNSCPEMLIVDVQGRIFTEVNENVEDVEVELDGSADQDMTSEVGEYVFADMPIGGAYVIDPGKNDDVMNGVSTLDLVMIQKHLLQLRELDSPYKLIAADINHDEKVTAIDLIQLRKLILGVVEEFPANTSWRFVDALYEFPIPTDPWDEAFPEEYDIPALNTNMSIDFVGVKIGDVNGSVTANVTGDITENRSDKTLSLIYTDRLVQEGEQVIVPLRSSNFEQIAGLQLTLDNKGLILDRVEEGVLEMNSGNIGKLQDAQTTLSWNDRGGIQQTTKSADVLFNLVFTASETGRLSTMLSLSDQVIQTEAYRLLATTEFEEINISLDAEISNDDVYEGYTLHQNEPNPWSRMTTISIESIKDMEGTLTVKDALGKLIVSKDVALVTGLNELVLTKNDVPVGGVYFYTLTIGDVQLSKQMIRME